MTQKNWFKIGCEKRTISESESIDIHRIENDMNEIGFNKTLNGVHLLNDNS